MIPTSPSLFERLREGKADSLDWERFHDIYLPLIRRWIARVPGLEGEADDVAQEVFVVLVRALPGFEREREGSFRAWLRRVTANRVKEQLRQLPDRTSAFLDQLADSNSLLAKRIDEEHEKHVCDSLLATVRDDFNESTWRAFQMFALEGRSAAEVANELKPMTVNAVVKAKARVLARLREEAGGFLD